MAIMEKGVQAEPGSVQALDPFNRMPPGWTLTQPPGKWPWDRPPKYVNPDEAVSYVIDRLEDEDVHEQFVKLMFAGISIEEIVNTIGIGGFSEGYFTPDVAEIIKPPIAFYLLGVAADYQIPVKFFATPDGMPVRDTGIDELQLLQIMKDRNPQFARHILDNIGKTEVEDIRPEPEGFMEVAEDMAEMVLGEESYEEDEE